MDSTHEADYHCPDGYDANVAGEGSARCTGACYKKGDLASFLTALQYHARARNASLLVHDSDLDRYMAAAKTGAYVPIPTTKGYMTVCTPEKGTTCRENNFPAHKGKEK
jgi:hypothetical protein